MNQSAIVRQTEAIEVAVGLPARDQIKLRVEVDTEGEILSATLRVVGCMELLHLAQALRLKLSGRLSAVTLPEGLSHSAILLREALLKAQGKWSFPYSEEELCHCRAVPTSRVDAAVISGCHTVDAVKRATSASSSCGTCRPDVEAVIRHRTGLPTK